MGSQIVIVHEQRSRKKWAAMGFLLLFTLGIISWFISPDVIKWIKGGSRTLRIALMEVPPAQEQLIITVILTLLMALVAGLIVTIFAPKKSINVQEKDLIKERLDGVKYHEKAKKRQRTLNREMRTYVESKNKK
jgi:uncharacterized membrane protein YraQ (UPF0718 family)